MFLIGIRSFQLREKKPKLEVQSPGARIYFFATFFTKNSVVFMPIVQDASRNTCKTTRFAFNQIHHGTDYDNQGNH